jgi:glycosyltransferase involved in cell wall biosynthesis|tara:strand:+ start:8126 stop:9313 length:1188 start_codon:yes stop_codon:yes gene_type:complete
LLVYRAAALLVATPRRCMNICLTVNSSPWSGFKGGGQIAVHYLATYLAKNGCKVWVIYTGNNGRQIPSSLSYNAIFAKHFNVKTINLNIFSVAFQVFKLSRKVQLDIIHGNGEETFFLPFIKKITGSKFVLTSHSPFIPQTGLIRALKCPTQMLKRLNFYLLRAAAIRADLLLTYSNFSRRLVEDGIRGKYNNAINTISPGIDPSWFKVSVQKKEKISNLLYFGRVEHEKGIDILLKSFANVLQKFPDLKLHLIGEGNYMDLSKRLCEELDVSNNVIFYGWKEKDEIQKIMSGCDLCVLPSRIESFGLTIAESMAAGIPVISTTAGAIPEIMKDGETGLLVPPDDIEALKKAIIYALENRDKMQNRAKTAQEKVKNFFLWDSAAKKHNEIYKSLL